MFDVMSALVLELGVSVGAGIRSIRVGKETSYECVGGFWC